MLENKVVLITGATGGLGRVVAKRFAQQGAWLTLVGTKQEKLQQFATTLDLPDDRILIHAADLNQPETATTLVKSTLGKFGRLDTLLHLVGGWSGGDPLVSVDVEQLKTMLQQHLWTTFHLVQACIPAMELNHWGRILVISSPNASHPVANVSPYVIGKAAQEALILSLAQEVKDRSITANILLVKAIDVEHVRDKQPDSKNAEWTTPEEITATLLYLSIDETGVITGARIPLYAG